jgi:PAS domain S-box-containing protein
MMQTAPAFVSPAVVARLRQGSRLGGLIAGSLGLLALIGWAWGISILESLGPSWAPMKANTALCLICLGAALWLFGGGSPSRHRTIVRLLAAFAVTVAALTLTQDLLGWHLGLDELLFLDRASATRPGRMAPNTATLLVLIGVAVLRLDDRSPADLVSQWLGLVASITALVTLCGHLYGVDALYVVPGFGSLSVYTASCVLLLGMSVLAAQPRGGLMLVLSANTSGGTLARRLLPVLVVMPIGIGWLRWVGEQQGLYGTAFGLAVFTIANMLTIGAIAWFVTRRLIDSEYTRRQAQELMRAISDNASAAIYAKDLEGRYLFVNRRFTELFHTDVDRVLGKTDYDLFTKPEADGFRRMDQRVAAAGVALTEEEPVPQHDGVHTYISVKCPLRDEAGGLYAVFGISTDITDRKRAEEALRANEERTRLILDTALDAVIAMDTTGAITGWSPQAETAFGWTRPEVIGRSLADTIIPHRYRESHRRGLELFLSTGRAPALNTRLELSALHRDGHEFPIELSITPLTIGDAVSFSAFVRDITARKHTEQALVESWQRYRALAESLPHLVWTCRPDGYCDFLSRQWVEYTGRPAEQQLGYGWAEQLHPDDRDRARAEWAAATVREDTFDIEFRIRRGDGVYRWFKTRAVPFRDVSGTVVKWFGSNTDFDDYKRSEQRLHAQLERLNLLDRLTRAIGERQDLQSILQVVIGSLEDQLPLDFGCVCLYDRADKSLIVTRVGVKSRALALELSMLERASVPIDQNGLSRCVRGQLVYEADTAQSTFPFPGRLARVGLRSLVAAPLMVESNVFGVLIAARREPASFSSPECEFLRQLSEHVGLAAHQAELYVALQRAYEDLRQTQQAVMQQERLKAVGQMASGIAHDINNAISPVALYTEWLLDTEPELSTRAREYLSIIQRAADDVAQTVARMREFYRERGPQFAAAAIDVNHLVRDVAELTRARWSDMPQQRGVVIQLATDLTPGTPSILGLESEIREALTNLIFNAVDAMPEGGHLVLRTRMTGDGSGSRDALMSPRVHIEVSDTGIGMDAETRRRCLEPFFTTKGERGTGLGLAMVYGTVQRHGADIEVESTHGQGTTIRLVFAAHLATAGSPPPGQREDPRPSRLRILVIDDDPLLLKSLRDVLESDGHVVTAANGGQPGIDTFRASHRESEPFAVVITDLGMPYIDGRQVANTVKATAPLTPVILLTGWGQRLVDDGDVPSHVDYVLNKPPKLSELRRALYELTSEPKS